MKGLFFILNIIFILCIQNVIGQPGSKWIDLEGKVINEALEGPIKATISLESLPYGADIRVFHSDQESGEFSFKVKENKEYKVKVEAKGYISIEEVISIESESKTKLFSLMPSGSGSILRLDINFKQSKAEILKESYKELDRLLNMLENYPKMEIQLEGHTDFRGSASANMRLSEKRVKAVKSYLTSKSVDSDRIKTKAFGGTQPLSKNNTEEAKLNNRRVEARILKTE
ncbi:OmpA family protein [Marivirga sericea]|uniref:OmpA family protein n=1 Tax=Marivirga sericea TaxID=1028 RepID=A0A1X7LBQ5_9BACT|nr:OmpA family protein [Marivirga sericea]SMG50833.1 OmpA family protein [Marivirga sericea]